MEHHWQPHQKGRPEGIRHLLHRGPYPLYSCQVPFSSWWTLLHILNFPGTRPSRTPWTSARRWEKEEASWRSLRLLRSTTSSTKMPRRAKPSTLTANMAADLYFGCRTGKKIVKFSQKRNLFFMYILFRGYDDITGTVNVTYFGDESPFELTTMWRKNNPKSSQRPFCVATRLVGSFTIGMSLSKSF